VLEGDVYEKLKKHVLYQSYRDGETITISEAIRRAVLKYYGDQQKEMF